MNDDYADGHVENLEQKPEIGPGDELEPCQFQPLDANEISLEREWCRPGPANRDRLDALMAKALRAEESGQGTWAAADFNNLACAYLWRYKEERKPRALEYFEQANTLPCTEQEQLIIQRNKNLLELY